MRFHSFHLYSHNVIIIIKFKEMENYFSYIFIKLIGINIPASARKPNLLQMQHKFWVSTFQCFICMAMGGDFMKIPMVKESCSLIRGRRKKYVNQKGVNWKG